MVKLLVIGASGMVGSRFVDLTEWDYKITAIDEKTLDITKKEDVEKYFKNKEFDTVLNFAAYTNVDGAEKEKGDKSGFVWALNVLGPQNLAEICLKKNIFLVHISTDFVFPGNPDYPGPYNEDSKLPESPDGIGWYGWTKKMAEDKVVGSGVKNSIVRYGYPFRASGYDLKLDWARNLIKMYSENKLYPLFADQVQSILYVDDLIEPLCKIIENNAEGVSHIASSDTVTPYEAGSYLLNVYTGKKVELQKGSMDEFLKVPGRTPRPRLGGLNSEKTQKTLGLEFNSWQEMISKFVKLYVKEYE